MPLSYHTPFKETRIWLNIAKWLDNRLKHPCHAHTSDVKVQLHASRYTYLDVHVSCEEADWQGKNEAIYTPKLLIEVLSPSTEAMIGEESSSTTRSSLASRNMCW